MVFHRSLSDCNLLKSPGLFTVFWPHSIMLQFGRSPLVIQPTNPSVPLIIFTNWTEITNHDWYYCHLHVPYTFQITTKVEVLILLFTFFQFYSVVSQDSKVHNFAISLSFFLLIIIRSGLLAELRWSVSMSKSHRSLCVSFSRTDAGLCLYHLFVWSNLNFLHFSLACRVASSLKLLLCPTYGIRL